MPKTIMIQGTTSDAGKTMLVAGLCRWLKRHKQNVVPFKPQNMALNSAVTDDGGEIGRAQALQAIACKLPAHTDMNPVLIKPSSDTQAQIVIHGKAITDMNAKRFHDYKKFAMDAVLESHSRLEQQFDTIVVEGAGSPAEINLRENDIANMGFAEAVDCPVILIADIDRGGVFAHIAGTLELLSESERNRVQGFVINRFRGDIALLESGLDWLESKTGKPVLGVLPYLKNFYLDAEDAIQGQTPVKKSNRAFTIVIPVLERISNHTDFDALKLHADIHVHFAAPGQALPPADLIILPGSKNVRKDLDVLRSYNWHKDINRHLRFGGKLIGICGGYQMLGKNISDPDGVEDNPGTTQGLELLDIETLIEKNKTLVKRNVRFNPNLIEIIQTQAKDISASTSCITSDHACEFSAYEIHCGKSWGDACDSPAFMFYEDENEIHDGAISNNENIIGTYLHGIFDSPKATNTILSWAGYSGTENAIDLNQHREVQLERLADTLDEHLDKSFLSSLLCKKYEKEKLSL